LPLTEGRCRVGYVKSMGGHRANGPAPAQEVISPMQPERNTRRSYSTGSLYVHRDGNGVETWYGRWRIGSRRVNRKVGLKRAPGTREGLTKAQAEAELRRLMNTHTEVAARTGMTLVDAAERYVDHIEIRGAKRATVMDYRSYVRVHFEPFFGDRPLDAIHRREVEEFLRLKLRQGKAPKSVRNWMGLLYATFSHARRKRWCEVNPCEEVDMPARVTNEDIHFLDSDELQALLRAVKGKMAALDSALYITAAMTGMRQGELVALRWRDVDWVARRIRVRQNHVRGQFGTPKSKRSSRSVPLADALAGELHRYFQGSNWQGDDDLVFASPATGQPLGRSRLITRFKEARDRAGLREVRFHDLRHTFGTMMAAQGVPLRTLQEWMGHRDLSTTQIYADYAPSEREAEYVDRAFPSVHLSVQSERNSHDLTAPSEAL
jgi:integrase